MPYHLVIMKWLISLTKLVLAKMDKIILYVIYSNKAMNGYPGHTTLQTNKGVFHVFFKW